MRRLWSIILLLILLATTAPSSVLGAEDTSIHLVVPYRSQLDGSPYAESNCGPAAIGMIIEAYGTPVSTDELRAMVNDLQGTWGIFESGTLIENLAVIAEHYGLQPLDLFEGGGFRRWTLDDVRRHLQAGYPVVPQVWYRGLPSHEESEYNGDHYIVLIGFEGDEFIFHDPIDAREPGANKRISAERLERAWQNSDFPYAALAVAPGPGSQQSLIPTPTPIPTATWTPSPTPIPTATWTPSPTPIPTATWTPSPTATSTATPTATSTSTPDPTATPRVIPTVEPSPTPLRPVAGGVAVSPDNLGSPTAIVVLVLAWLVGTFTMGGRRRF